MNGSANHSPSITDELRKNIVSLREPYGSNGAWNILKNSITE